MTIVTNEQLEEMIQHALKRLSKRYLENLNNVAFLIEDEPSELQREQLKLRENETLFGLYEGVPLPLRQGRTKLLPDKITVFKGPIIRSSSDIDEISKKIDHTIWHEVAHYYGLNHENIHSLEK